MVEQAIEPIQAEMRVLGITLLPPSVGASRMAALRDLWACAGLEAIEYMRNNGATNIRRFRGLPTTTTMAAIYADTRHHAAGRR